MKSKLILLLCLLIMLNCFVTSYAEDFSKTFSASDYTKSNIVSATDGTKFWVNGDFSLSFNSTYEGRAIMKISMLALEGGKKALVFFNKTKEGENVTYESAPDKKDAVGGGMINVTNVTDINSVKQDSFKDYTFYVYVKQGVNTIFVPSNNITNDCGKYAYQISEGVRCNSKVMFKSISLVKDNENSTVYPHNIPESNLTYHSGGQIVEGYDATDKFTSHTVRQEYPAMFTVVPFYVENDGDYIVNIRYNAYTTNDVTKKIPAAVFVDADISSLDNTEWQKFLDTDSYGEDEIKEVTDTHLETITNSGVITALDLGNWMTSLYDENQKSAPFYHLKSFKLSNLAKGEHTLLFYTAKDILENTDAVVNKDVYFNSFEFEFLTPEYEKVETHFVPVVNMYDGTKHKASIPTTYNEATDLVKLSQNEWKNKLHIPVTVANNTDATKNGMVVIVFYNGVKMVSVDTHSFTLLPYQSYEEVLVSSFENITADAFKVFIWEKEAASSFTDDIINLEKEDEPEVIVPLKIEAENAVYAETSATTHSGSAITAGYKQTKNSVTGSPVVVGGGNLIFKFNSPKAQRVSIKISYYMGADCGDWRGAFFNPVATPSYFTKDMVAGVDYPQLSQIFFAENSWCSKTKEYTFTALVDAKAGENVLWFPGRNLLYASDDGQSTISMYADEKGKRPNNQTQVDYIIVTPQLYNVTQID